MFFFQSVMNSVLSVPLHLSILLEYTVSSTLTFSLTHSESLSGWTWSFHLMTYIHCCSVRVSFTCFGCRQNVIAIMQRSPSLYSIRRGHFSSPSLFFLIITLFHNIMLAWIAFKISISGATVTRRQCRAIKWRINRDVIIVKKVSVQLWKLKFYSFPRLPPWKQLRKLFGSRCKILQLLCCLTLITTKF